MADGYSKFITGHRTLFRSGNHNVSEKARDYLAGLMQAEKRNMERMAEVVPEADDQVLQNFLTHSAWDERAVMDQVAQDADNWLGGLEGSGLYIDETAIAKKGDKSVGVARQWNGRLGKKENSQVGVFGALGKGDHVSLLDARLYLPKEWTENTARCRQAGVPRAHQTHKTKLELALEIVDHAQASGIRFEWVGFDGLYGNSLAFLEAIAQKDLVFMADIHKDRHIYLEDPDPYLPENRDGRGRKRCIYRSDQSSLEVQQWVKDQPESAWHRKVLRDTTKGKLVVEVLHRRVWLWDKRSRMRRHWHLIVRREIGSPETLKYSLCNTSQRISVIKLARMQAQRYWIERAFQEAKSHIGLSQYQARKWSSWHRHMALVMMALQFMTQEKIRNEQAHPLLSCHDIQILLAKTLPSRQSNHEELIRQMVERHRRRQAAQNSATRCQAYNGQKRE